MSGEYAVLIIIAVSAAIIMSVYVRRALQGRIHDANLRTMGSASLALNQNINIEYEPYYVVSTTNTDQQTDDRSYHLPGGNYFKVIDFERRTSTSGQQLEPGRAR